MSSPEPPAGAFAEWCGKQGFGAAPEDWRFVAAGWESEIWAFSLRGRRLVLREYHGADGGTKSRTESSALVALAGCDYPVPAVVAFEPDSRPLGRPFIIVEWIEGPLLAERHRYGADRSGVLQAKLHGLGVDRLAERGFAGPTYPEPVVVGQIAEWSRMVGDLGVRGFEGAMEFLTAGAARVPRGSLGMVHWDFHPWNVIDSSERGPVVIDWTSATITDVRFDLGAALILWISNRIPEGGVDHLEAYQGTLGQPVDDLEFFEAAAALRRLFSGVVGLRDGPERLGMRADARDEIRRHLPGLIAVYRRWREVGGPPIADVESLS